MWFGIALVFLGIIFLLQNLGILTENVWEIIWPVVIIIIGAAILFRRSNPAICCPPKDKKDPDSK